MVARRPAQHERTAPVLRHHGIHCGDGRSGRQACDVKGVVANGRVRIQMSSTMVDEGTNVANHFFAVTSLKVLRRGRP